MPSAKGRLLKLLGGIALREAGIDEAHDLGRRYRLLHLSGEGVATPGFEPGDKVQVLLPSDDVRTYTPIGWNGRSSLLVYLHSAVTPGPRWARAAKAGDRLRFIGPQRSLQLPPGKAVLVGDETSIAVAAAYARGRSVVAVIEADDVDEARAAAAAVGLGDARIVRREGAGYRALADAALAAGAGDAGAVIGITGGAALIQGVRALVRERATVKVKAYWAPGKVGLD